MSEPEIQPATQPATETEPDRVPPSLIRLSIALVVGSIVLSIAVVWLLAHRVAGGGGRGDLAHLQIEPPADPFDVATEHERIRDAQRVLLDHWQWADPSHTHVRVPLSVAIDRYLGGRR